jgi:hypothetical protein
MRNRDEHACRNGHIHTRIRSAPFEAELEVLWHKPTTAVFGHYSWHKPFLSV